MQDLNFRLQFSFLVDIDVKRFPTFVIYFLLRALALYVIKNIYNFFFATTPFHREHNLPRQTLVNYMSLLYMSIANFQPYFGNLSQMYHVFFFFWV